jgi:hypothetical protein
MNQTRLALALGEIAMNPAGYRDDFYDWLNANGHIYIAFEREADRIRARGRDHYSHRTIWEYLRHETALREVSGERKMNDHQTKSCALLYSRLHPEAGQFFNFRSVSVGDMARAA